MDALFAQSRRKAHQRCERLSTKVTSETVITPARSALRKTLVRARVEHKEGLTLQKTSFRVSENVKRGPRHPELQHSAMSGVESRVLLNSSSFAFGNRFVPTRRSRRYHAYIEISQTSRR